MRIQETMVHCLDCKHEWLAEMVVDAPVEIWTASAKSLNCPKCGANAKKIAFGRGDVPDPKPIQLGLTDVEKRHEWLKLHDNGMSSECIADVMCGLPNQGNYPHDGSDFGRCERLLMLYPEWRERLSEMSAINMAWAALVPKWDKIVAAWKHDKELWEVKGQKAKGWKCYDLMRSILEPAEAEMYKKTA